MRFICFCSFSYSWFSLYHPMWKIKASVPIQMCSGRVFPLEKATSPSGSGSCACEPYQSFNLRTWRDLNSFSDKHINTLAFAAYCALTVTLLATCTFPCLCNNFSSSFLNLTFQIKSFFYLRANGFVLIACQTGHIWNDLKQIFCFANNNISVD